MAINFDLIRVHAKPGDEEISDIRLALALHDKEEDRTEILQVKESGHKYYLCLCGALKIKDRRTGNFLEGDQVPDGLIAKMENWEFPRYPYSVHATPWFEWVDEQGDPLCEVFQEISLDPEKEIQHLKEILKHSKEEAA